MRDRLVQGLGLLLLVAGGLWFVSHTEWVDEVDFRAAQGEAAGNPFHATQQLARRLGAEVTRATSLSPLPPRQATLLLASWDGELFPGQMQGLRRWVEQGGHLVIESSALDRGTLAEWLPIRPVRGAASPRPAPAAPPKVPDEDDNALEATAPTVPRKPSFRPIEPPCRTFVEPAGVPPAYPGGPRRFEVCAMVLFGTGLSTRAALLWSLVGPGGPMALRVAVGQGRVTVVDTPGFLRGEQVLWGDNALVTAAILQIRRGEPLWFVAEESRPPLLRWLWDRAGAVLLLALCATLLALWRGGVRFGPLGLAAATARRSMAEQITGTARFLRRSDAPALHRAQLQALERAACAHLRGYAHLDRPARAQALARATGLDPQALLTALDPGRTARRPAALVPVLERLETARRLLLQAPGHSHPHPDPQTTRTSPHADPTR